VHVTLSRWWERRSHELAEPTCADYRWRIDHILRHVATVPTCELDAKAIDELRIKLRRCKLSARSINMVLDVLAQALDDAVDYGLLAGNPARGKRRREKVPKGPRSFLEPDMVVDLLHEAGAWEVALPAHQRYGRRALVACLCLAGPRISEITEAKRGDLDINAGVLRLGKKTAAGIDRHLELTACLRDQLRAHLEAAPAGLRETYGAALPVFPTRTGGARERKARQAGQAAAALAGDAAHAAADVREPVLLRRA
jgi:integrase